jgi:hypothetical protein
MATFRPTGGANVAISTRLFEPTNIPSDIINIRDI